MRTRRGNRKRSSQDGQATVELAIALPLIGLLILAVIQAALVGRTQLALQGAVREAARACAVNAGCNAASIVASLTDSDTSVTSSMGSDVIVSAEADVPMVLPWTGDVNFSVSASATMRLEQQ